MQGVRLVSDIIVHGTSPWHRYDVIQTACGKMLALVALSWRMPATGATTSDSIDCMACIAAETLWTR
jgi:hypothetical protein